MHVCLFDIDGTLLNTGGAGQAAMEAALASEFRAVGPVEGISTAGRTDRAIVGDLFDYYSVAFDDPACDRFLRAYLEHLPKQLVERKGTVLPGVQVLIESLAARDDVALGLLTGNFRDGARVKLTYFGLERHFPFGGFGDRHLDRDDVAREALGEVRSRLDGQFSIDRLWVIGDTPADVRCARAIGANAVAVATGVFSHGDLQAAGPDHLWPDFTDPGPLLALLG
jgi:phosphoglycolate phosphatase-like HAD superfamily hydrolase